ncbi:MAG: 4Fe-4S binding protein [Clostridiales bacterium]|jgi:NAD-dependent dihydropyrimidine dehydrogenase PreA subunit|nr:4Fe-4S binding protein [Eubacteriales bacterium]MDH7565820.1 4Fe-4S binding protein [Clostridiales bacterium]
MAVRKIIWIDEDKCNGCGMCVRNCAEGALTVIDGKARVVKDSFCDGLGACLGHCPQDALKIVEREADDFDEEEAAKYAGSLKEKNPGHRSAGERQTAHHHGGECPGSKMMLLRNRSGGPQKSVPAGSADIEVKIKPQLQNWPVQMKLVPENAPYFDGANLLVTADCVPFAYPNYHLDLLKGRVVVVGCPKLDDIEFYVDKLTGIIEKNHLQSITVVHMEVPCCSGLVRAVEAAVRNSGKRVTVEKVKIGIHGEILEE